jgi:hypothetical protein
MKKEKKKTFYKMGEIKELIEKIRKIWQYRCEGCLADTGGCCCAEDKERAILELIRDLEIKK